MNGERPRQGGRSQLPPALIIAIETAVEDALDSHGEVDDDRCPTCCGWISRQCLLCRGTPDPIVSIEEIARGQAAVDRAVRRRRAA
jgi:hypothetical protein